MKIAFVINPKAGVLKNPAQEVKLMASRLSAFEMEFAITQRAGHATELATQFVRRGCDVVMAVGGDGTVNETAQGLLGSAVPLAILPCGSGNGVARGLGIPVKLSKAFSLLENFRRRQIDVGILKTGNSSKFFFGFAGVGFDAFVGHMFNQRKGRRGLLPYVWLSLKGFGKFRPATLKMYFDEERVTEAPFILAIANTREYGNGAIIAPYAEADDGYFDISLLRRFSFLRGILQGYRLFNGTIDRISEMSTYRAKGVRLQSDQPILYHADGEVSESTGDISISMDSRRLTVAVPRS